MAYEDQELKAPEEYDPKEIHIVSNTHWDREWVYSSSETRLLMMEFMDSLLDLLDEQPEYHSFTMDSQTLCVQDYLEFRPERREQLEHFGNLLLPLLRHRVESMLGLVIVEPGIFEVEGSEQEDLRSGFVLVQEVGGGLGMCRG